MQLAKAAPAAPMANHPQTDVAADVTVQANRIAALSQAAAEASARPFVPLPANVTAERQRAVVKLPKLLAKAPAGQLVAASVSKAATELAAVNAVRGSNRGGTTGMRHAARGGEPPGNRGNAARGGEQPGNRGNAARGGEQPGNRGNAARGGERRTGGIGSPRGAEHAAGRAASSVESPWEAARNDAKASNRGAVRGNAQAGGRGGQRGNSPSGGRNHSSAGGRSSAPAGGRSTSRGGSSSSKPRGGRNR